MTDPHFQALAIGGSAGSLPVAADLLGELPAADCALAVVVCIHTASRHADDLCSELARHCALPVIEAGERIPLRAGRVYVAAGGYHLLVERSRHFALCAGEHVSFARPSIDLMFETMAETYRNRLIGILLSGANRDGAAGLRRIQELGGTTLVQHPETARAPQMPTAALALFTPDRQNTPDQLSVGLRDLLRATCQ